MKHLMIGCRCVCLLGLAGAVAFGCGSGTGPGPAPAEQSAVEGAAMSGAEAPHEEKPVDGDWLYSRLPAEMENLNPFTSQDAYSARLNAVVFDSLLERDNQTLELKRKLADSWEISEDKLTYTFHLHRGVTFSDGKPLTAADVKFSFDTLKDPKTDAPHMRNYYQDVSSCEVLDEFTVRFTCTKPYFKHFGVLGELPVIPKHIYEVGDFNNHPNNRNPIGSGPYTLERWQTGQELVLVRNESYWDTKPHVLKRVYKIITNDAAAFQVLSRGELDSMGVRPEIWVTRASESSFSVKFNKFAYYLPSFTYIGWNIRRPQFSDRRVRQSLTMLLNREIIRDQIYYGLAQIVTCPFFVDEPEYDKSVQPWPFDPERAKKQLDEVGWVYPPGSAVRSKDGAPLAFELLIVNSSPEAEQIATIYQEELKRAGISMTIRELEWATFLQSVQEQNFDASMLGWSLAPDPDPYQIWHSSQAVKDGSNAVGFVNEEADDIMDKGRLEFDHAKRVEMYHRMDAIIHEEQPYTFLFCPKALVAVDKRFHDVKTYPYGLDSREWWTPLESQRYR